MGDIRRVNEIEKVSTYMKNGERAARGASEAMAEQVYGNVGRTAACDTFTASAELTAENGLKQALVRAGEKAVARELAAAPSEAIPGIGEVVAIGVGVITVLDVGYEIYKGLTGR